MELNKINVVIAGKSYSLMTADDPDYLYELTRQLDKRIKDFLEKNDNVSVMTASVMVALEILDDDNKINSNIDNIRTQIKTYVDEAAKARLEADEARASLVVAEEKIERLETELKLYELRKTADGSKG
ncbi:MAG: cell division protein ZapA [Oscillospiraceae bacterium]|nr:cell division protein ZapA [Oscillospiraceae bacterium]